MATTLRLATRRSALARAQAFQLGQLLTARTGVAVELVPMATTGDRSPDQAVNAFAVKGLFVDTVRAAVVDGDCDLVVHSFKDLPVEAVPGLRIAAVPPREDPRDLLVTREPHGLSTLPDGTTVGTSSVRRRLQLLRARPRLTVTPLRGNLDTRLRRVADGDLDAVVIAYAGLRRLYTAAEHGGVGPLRLALNAVALEAGELLPAPAQGALAVECRDDDERVQSLLAQIDDAPSRQAVTAERAFLAAVGGGCLAPVGALAVPLGAGRLQLAGWIGDVNGGPGVRATVAGACDRPGAASQLGRDLAAELRLAGAEPLLDAIKQERSRP